MSEKRYLLATFTDETHTRVTICSAYWSDITRAINEFTYVTYSTDKKEVFRNLRQRGFHACDGIWMKLEI